jgi:hypothetical protein
MDMLIENFDGNVLYAGQFILQQPTGQVFCMALRMEAQFITLILGALKKNKNGEHNFRCIPSLPAFVMLSTNLVLTRIHQEDGLKHSPY